MCLLGLAPGYPLVLAMLFVVGCSAAGFHAVAPPMIGRVAGLRLGRGMSWFMVGGELGRTLGPVIAVTAFLRIGFSGMPWLMIGGIAASVALAVRLRGVPTHPEGAHRGLPLAAALRRMRPLLLPLTAVVLGRAFFLAALGVYLPTYLTEQGEGLWLAGVSLTVLEIAGVGGALLGGSLSDHWGRRRVVAAAMALAAIFLFAFLAATGWMRFLLLLGLGFSGLSITPVLMALVQEAFPENRALANGLYMGMSFVLRSVGTIGLGLLGDAFGMRTAFLVAGVILLAALPAVRLLPRRRVELEHAGR
jgi:FSR family fosmidomycin resistance protein-like MFS transporter